MPLNFSVTDVTARVPVAVNLTTTAGHPPVAKQAFTTATPGLLTVTGPVVKRLGRTALTHTGARNALVPVRRSLPQLPRAGHVAKPPTANASFLGDWWQRVVNMWKGFLSLFMSNVEKNNPEAVYDAAIDTAITKHNEFKVAASNIILMRDRTQNALETKQKDLKTVKERLTVVDLDNEKEVALALITREETLTAEIAGLTEKLDGLVAKAESVKDSLIKNEAEVRRLQQEKLSTLGEMEQAKAEIRMQEQLSKLSTDADLRALENVREERDRLKAQAKLGEELQDNSLDAKMDKIDQRVAQTSAEARLEAMRKARAAQTQAATGAPVTKTI